MTIRQIEYVLALDKYRHYVRASESCFVTQSTLTIQIKKLEDEIGTLLFDRKKNPLVPTAMGEIFISKARHIMQDINTLKELFNKEYNEMAGTFRLGIIPTLSPYLLPLFINDFLSNYPQIKLEIEELESSKIIESIKSGKLDIGILSTPLNEGEIREISMFYEPFLLYLNNSSELLDFEGRIKVTQLKTKYIRLLREGHCFRNQMMKFCKLSELQNSDNLQIEGGSIETLKRIIKETSGYTLIPELSYEELVDKNFIKRFEEPEPAREVSIVVHQHFTKELLLTELRKYILKHIPERFKRNDRFRKLEWR